MNLRIILNTLDQMAETAPVTNRSAIRRPRRFNRKNVFLVYGHNKGRRESVERFLERGRLAPIVLEKRTVSGSWLDGIERYRKVVGFAVVLMTPDDLGPWVMR